MENPMSEKENIIKDARSHFTIRDELNYSAIKDIRNLFRLENSIKIDK